MNTRANWQWKMASFIIALGWTMRLVFFHVFFYKNWSTTIKWLLSLIEYNSSIIANICPMMCPTFAIFQLRPDDILIASINQHLFWRLTSLSRFFFCVSMLNCSVRVRSTKKWNKLIVEDFKLCDCAVVTVESSGSDLKIDSGESCMLDDLIANEYKDRFNNEHWIHYYCY